MNRTERAKIEAVNAVRDQMRSMKGRAPRGRIAILLGWGAWSALWIGWAAWITYRVLP